MTLTPSQERVHEIRRLLHAVGELRFRLFAAVDVEPGEEMEHELRAATRHLRYVEEDLEAVLETLTSEKPEAP